MLFIALIKVLFYATRYYFTNYTPFTNIGLKQTADANQSFVEILVRNHSKALFFDLAKKTFFSKKKKTWQSPGNLALWILTFPSDNERSCYNT